MFLTILFGAALYLVVAGATHGYAKHRWPPKMYRKQVYISGSGWEWRDYDENSNERFFSTTFWPFYWVFIWPFTKMNEVTFSKIEKSVGAEIAKNKVRTADLRATREQLQASNEELERAEAELDKEIAKTL